MKMVDKFWYYIDLIKNKGWVSTKDYGYPIESGDYFVIHWTFRDNAARNKYGFEFFVKTAHFNKGSKTFLGDSWDSPTLYWRPIMEFPVLGRDMKIDDDYRSFNKAKMEHLARKSKQSVPVMCTCIGCNNVATHTWSGHPTCDDCATPMRKERKV